jgi:hypothetical protein
VFAELPLKRSLDAGGNGEYPLYARGRRWANCGMRGLAKRAICMDSTVSVSVNQLCRGAEKQKDCEEDNEQSVSVSIAPPHFADP